MDNRNNKGQFNKGAQPYNKGKTRYNHAEVIGAYNKLHNMSEVARSLKMTHVSVAKILKEHNIERVKATRHKKREAYKTQILKMYNAGYSSTKIVKLLNNEVSYTTIITCLKEAGIEVRAAGFQKREQNPAWNGGITLDERGYVLIKSNNHPRRNNNGYVREHIVVAEQKINRPLKKGETVHHINGDVKDNRPENLFVFENRGKHTKYHWEQRNKLEDSTGLDAGPFARTPAQLKGVL